MSDLYETDDPGFTKVNFSSTVSAADRLEEQIASSAAPSTGIFTGTLRGYESDQYIFPTEMQRMYVTASITQHSGNKIVFSTPVGDVVGTIMLNDGVVDFEGNATESAKIFIQSTQQVFNEEIDKQANKRLAKLLEQREGFKPV